MLRACTCVACPRVDAKLIVSLTAPAAKAWNLYHHMSAPVGYKLAFNYLKAERYTDAIEVCTQVLQHFPDYPIREQVLDKAIALLYE